VPLVDETESPRKRGLVSVSSIRASFTRAASLCTAFVSLVHTATPSAPTDRGRSQAQLNFAAASSVTRAGRPRRSRGPANPRRSARNGTPASRHT
jgi:hypothetical protein